MASLGSDASEQSAKVSRENLIFRQFAKVFSLESFPLYGMTGFHMTAATTMMTAVTWQMFANVTRSNKVRTSRYRYMLSIIY